MSTPMTSSPRTRRPRRQAYHHGDLPRAVREAAAARLAETGDVSLREIATALGVDPAALYRHFPDKHAIVRGWLLDGFVALAQRMREAVAQRRTPATRLAAIGEAYVRFAVAQPRRFQAMFGRERVPSTEIEGHHPDGLTPWALLLASVEALRAAGGSTLPSSRAALVAWSAVHGLAALAVDGRVDDLDAAIVDVTAVIVAGLQPRRG